MVKQRIPEVEGLPYRLGRNLNHDPRSRAFRVPRAVEIKNVSWSRRAPIFDQGSLGSCTGNAAAGWIATDNAVRQGLSDVNGASVDEAMAVDIYSRATHIDPYDESYPPTDTGSDGLSVTKVLQERGLIDSYTHGFAFEDVLAALQATPVLIGSLWYEQMFYPDDANFVRIGGQEVGGHEYLAVALDVDTEAIRFANSWGTSFGISGYFWMRYETLQTLLTRGGDATVPHALAVPNPPDPDDPQPIDKPGCFGKFVSRFRSK